MRAGESQQVLAFGGVLLLASMAMQASEIAAVSGFLDDVGLNQMLLVWLGDYSLMILLSGLESLIVDRFDRRTLVRWTTLGCAIAFAGLRLMFLFHAPVWISYSLVFLISDQLWLFFPLVFWVLVEDTFEPHQSRRLFPLISGFNFFGKLLGIGLAGVAPVVLASFGLSTLDILEAVAALYLVGFGLVVLAFRKPTPVQRTETNLISDEMVVLGGFKRHHRRPSAKGESFRETILDGWRFTRDVPSFHYLAVSVMALVVCDLILEFRFYAVSGVLFPRTGDYQTFYSIYRLAFTLAAFALQTFVTGRLIPKVGLKNTFLGLPIASLLGTLWMLVAPGVASGIGGMTLHKLPGTTVDETARKEVEGLVPAEHRGRVSILLDSYLYAVGSIIGCLIIGATVLIGLAMGTPLSFLSYLPASALAGLVGLWAAWRMRTVFDASLLNWRFSRRTRPSSILDKLTFP